MGEAMIQNCARYGSTRLILQNVKLESHRCLPSYKRDISLNTAINNSLRAENRHPRRQAQQKPHPGSKCNDRERRRDTAINPKIKPSFSHSEFLLGPHSVIAALKLQRRKLLKLYYDKDMTHSSKSDRRLSEILTLAKEANVVAVPVPKNELSKRTFASGGKVHNGVILETLPIPFPSVDALRPSDDLMSNHFFCTPHDKPASQHVKVLYPAPLTRCPPLVVMPYNVVDTNNISAILRSAYFFSVSALALPTRSTSHPSSFSRASSGAIEAVPLLGIPDPKEFVTKSKKAGFKILCTSLPSLSSQDENRKAMWRSKEHFKLPTNGSDFSRYVTSSPTILILGGEAAGVPPELSELADATVEIERARPTDEAGIDSLNVSVAAGIIFATVSRR